MNRTTRAIFAIFFVMVIAISAISICQGVLKSGKIDLTANKLYTLSGGTKEILVGLKQPITMKLFYTKTAAINSSIDQIRYYNNYYTYVRGLLEEYQANGGGNVKLEVIDPRPFTEEELAAVRYGLKRIPMSEEENFIFGLVVQTQFGVTKVIEFFTPDRQQLVEYDISYLIDTAITRDKRRIGVLSALDLIGDTDYMARMKQMQGQKPKPKWNIIRHLEEQFEVSMVPADTAEITGVDMLLVIHPKDLPQQAQFAIDQFILKGGRAIVCVDPHCVMDMPDMNQRMSGQPQSTSSNLPKLLNNWGLVMPANTFAGDRKLAVTGAARPGQPPSKILGVLKFSEAYHCFNKDNAITAQLNELTTLFPGVLKIKEHSADDDSPKLDYTPLLSTSSEGNAWRVDNDYELMNPDYAKFMRQFRDGTEPVVIGYMVTGDFTSAFPDGIQVPDEAAETEGQEGDESAGPTMKTLTGLTASAEPCAVIVLADVDMFSDMVAYRQTFFGIEPVGDNSSLMLNAIEDLSGSAQLIAIRSRGNFKRPFTVVDDIEYKANQESAAEESRIMAQIQGFEQQLNEKIQAVEGENKGQLINQTIVEEKKKIELELRQAEKDLRDIKMQKRQRVEALKRKMRNFCTLPGPILTLAIAVILGIYRSSKRRRYISHASDA